MNRVYEIMVSFPLPTMIKTAGALRSKWSEAQDVTDIWFHHIPRLLCGSCFRFVKPFSYWPQVTINHFVLAHASQINNLATGYSYDCSHGALISSKSPTFSYSRKVELCAPTGQEKAHLNLHNHLSEVDRVWGAISSICHTWAGDKLPLIKYHCESLLFH